MMPVPRRKKTELEKAEYLVAEYEMYYKSHRDKLDRWPKSKTTEINMLKVQVRLEGYKRIVAEIKERMSQIPS